ncbi:hypothetical protein K435DRAFT_806993 [Dendrothele bispora CBS 962.96]|uniref:Uncharacterized protein n=1 Tax=Dendrothele bispora (strain CBS 962.96) TaxID=1314807 RepID=A0A4S8L634_DENBC|nr:hypothetical protein K435DRAFT_806993 [Dendrothele bispora CBS 962.96]
MPILSILFSSPVSAVCTSKPSFVFIDYVKRRNQLSITDDSGSCLFQLRVPAKFPPHRELVQLFKSTHNRFHNDTRYPLASRTENVFNDGMFSTFWISGVASTHLHKTPFIAFFKLYLLRPFKQYQENASTWFRVDEIRYIDVQSLVIYSGIPAMRNLRHIATSCRTQFLEVWTPLLEWIII